MTSNPMPRFLSGLIRAALLLALPLGLWAPASAVQSSRPSQTSPADRPGGQACDPAGIVRFLAADSLRGRGSFTGESEKAAEFIASQFRAAGLRPLEGDDSPIDRFVVTRVTPETTVVLLGGAPASPESVMVSTDLDRGIWTEADTLPVFRMGETFDRSLFRKDHGIVLVPVRHAQMFDRFRRFANRPRVFGGEPVPGVLVAILTDGPAPATYRIERRGIRENPALANVVGVLPGRRTDEIVLISAHYDHLGIIRPVNGDSIANGADDNASGTSAVVCLARRFASAGTPERTLIFASFAAEEIGGFGARRLLGRLDPAKIVAMVNIEMIGKVSKFGPGTFWITGYDRSTLGAILAEGVRGTGFAAHPDPYPDENLFFRSDNAVFARAGVPAHTLSTTPIDVDSLYHTVNDEAESLDSAHIGRTVEAIAVSLKNVISGAATPGRIRIEGP